MKTIEKNFSLLAKFVIGIAIAWLGIIGFLGEGFTIVSGLPIIEFEYLKQLIFIIQISMAIAIFNPNLRTYVRPLVIIYFLIVVCNLYLFNSQIFELGFPKLAEFGKSALLELILIFAGFSELKRSY